MYGPRQANGLWNFAKELVCCLELNESCNEAGANELFSSDKFRGSETREERRCRCGAQPKLAHKMMDPSRGLTIRMFQCQCGERSWTQDAE